MTPYYLDEDLTTGNNDGTSWADAYQSWTDMTSGVTISEDTTVYIRSTGVVDSNRSLSIQTNGFVLSFEGDSDAVLYCTSGYSACITTGGTYTGSYLFKSITFNPTAGNGYGVRANATTQTDFDTCICLGGGTGGGLVRLGVADAVVNVYNSVGVGIVTGFVDIQAAGTVNLTNCYGQSSASVYDAGSGTLNLTTCASSDTTGSTGLQSVAYDTTTFTNVTSGSEDFHLVDGSPLIGAGTTTTYTTDYAGDAWGDPQDIGVYVYDAATDTWILTYDGNGNDGGTAPTDGNSPYDDGSTVTVLGNSGSLTLTDYVWAGWNTASDGSGTSYAESDTFTISADTTLYAVWTLDVQTITGVTYDKDGNIEPSCQVTLLSMTAGVPTAVVETVTSDATTGVFSFTVSDDTLDYQVVAHLDGTPNTFDASDNELTAVTGGTDTYLYLRSQADKTDSGTGNIFSLGMNGGFDG